MFCGAAPQILYTHAVILSEAKNLLWTDAQFLARCSLFSALCSLLSALRPLPEILHCVALRKRMTGRKTSCHTCAASEGSICRCVVAGITGRSARANYSKRSMRTKSSKRAGDGETVVFKSFRISGQIKKTLLLYRSSLRTPRTLRTAALTNRAVIRNNFHRHSERSEESVVDKCAVACLWSLPVALALCPRFFTALRSVQE